MSFTVGYLNFSVEEGGISKAERKALNKVKKLAKKAQHRDAKNVESIQAAALKQLEPFLLNQSKLNKRNLSTISQEVAKGLKSHPVEDEVKEKEVEDNQSLKKKEQGVISNSPSPSPQIITPIAESYQLEPEEELLDEFLEEEDLEEFRKKEILINDLSQKIEEVFENNLEDLQESIAGLQSIFTTTNKKYLAQTKLFPLSEDLQTNFREIHDQEERRRADLHETFNKCEKIFNRRIDVLNQSIHLYQLESEFLEQSIKGNTTYWNSFSLLQGSVGYRYGANYRMGEIVATLSAREGAIGKFEKLENHELEKHFLQNDSSPIETLQKISIAIDELKEEVLICNEALKNKTQSLSSLKLDLPKQFYRHHFQRLEAIKKDFSAIQIQLTERISHLRSSIKAEQANQKSEEELLPLKQEKTELTHRLDIIKRRQGEVEKFLSVRKHQFKLEGEHLETLEDVASFSFGNDYDHALSLVQRITALKEEVVLSQNWENLALPEQRQQQFSILSKRKQALEIEKLEFENTKLPARIQFIQTAVMTYQRYILNFEIGMESIRDHLQILAKIRLERVQWNLGPNRKIEFSHFY